MVMDSIVPEPLPSSLRRHKNKDLGHAKVEQGDFLIKAEVGTYNQSPVADYIVGVKSQKFTVFPMKNVDYSLVRINTPQNFPPHFMSKASDSSHGDPLYGRQA